MDLSFIYSYVVLRIEPSASHMPGKRPAPEPPPQSPQWSLELKSLGGVGAGEDWPARGSWEWLSVVALVS